MRLFVAIELPEAVRRAVEARLAPLRGSLPKARWVRVENLHLTLVFLGEVEAERVPPFATELAAVFARHPPFSLGLKDGGAFPPRGPGRVIWLGVDAEAGLASLQREVAEAASSVLGLEPETRPFSPHLTLARAPEPWPRPAVERFSQSFAGSLGPRFEVHEGLLMASELAPGGSRYRAVGHFPLKTAA
ncbi:MAG: RNA 2',3'-cyclic phosphodiesterase [Thermoanaerobaculia bacterium]